MENPVKDIAGVVETLCTGAPAAQQAAMERYFAPDAEFVHPLYWAPAFSYARTLAPATSRNAIRYVFRWHTMLSPATAVSVDSVAYDAQNLKMYLAIRQRFALWFVPLYATDVRRVTELTLRETAPSYAAAAAAAAAGLTGEPSPRFVIARQEDHYQMNEVLKFPLLGLGAYAWALVQLFSLGAVIAVAIVFEALGQIAVRVRKTLCPRKRA